MRGLACALALAALSFAYAALLAPPPAPAEIFAHPPWWLAWAAPRRSAWLDPLVDLAAAGGASRALALALCFAPPLGLAALGSRGLGAAMRALATGIASLACVLASVALLLPALWRPADPTFWAVAAGLAATAALSVHAPSLARALLDRSRPLAATLLGLLALAVVALWTEPTGSAPDAPLGATPWPVLPVLGLGVIGLAAAATHAAAGVAARLARPLASIRQRALLGGALAAVGAAPFALAMPLEESRAPASLALAAIGAAAGAHAAWRRSPTATRAWTGIALAALILGSERAALRFETLAQREQGAQIVEALFAYRRDHGSYPDALESLVPGYLQRIPRAPIGWLRDRGDAYRFVSFGETFALEFASTRWVQCTFTPRGEEEPDEVDASAPMGEDLPEELGEWELAEVGAARPSDAAPGEPPGRWSCAREDPTLPR